jgi:hypothetical protein
MHRRTTPRAIALLVTAIGLSLQWAPALSAPPALAEKQALTREAEQVHAWIARTHDNHGLPFMILDKKQAHLWVYDAAGHLQGHSPVLLGSARGDDTLPGIGSMKLSEIRPQDRTTPAGRFVAEVGINERRERVVWVDYDAAVSMHPVLTTNPKEQRQHRLDTPTPADNRVSFGCINVPTGFHRDVVLGTVNEGRSVVYILPEVRPLRTVFPQLAAPDAKVARR